mgnify:CR=1 FL=1
MQSVRDENRVPSLLGASSLDGTTPITAYVDPTTHELLVNASIDAGDIEIGAVEIKNSTDDTRATVSTKGLHIFDTVTNSLVPATYDYISYTSGSTTDTYVFKTGGSGGTTVSTLVITYTDSTKQTMSNLTKT